MLRVSEMARNTKKKKRIGWRDRERERDGCHYSVRDGLITLSQAFSLDTNTWMRRKNACPSFLVFLAWDFISCFQAVHL